MLLLHNKDNFVVSISVSLASNFLRPIDHLAFFRSKHNFLHRLRYVRKYCVT